ncbi:MAG: putative Ig domain-containing protein [Gemmataceae bacterium]|nr:putative Ig domain-containing protein [Gemmataceae bacterium]
MPAGLSINSVTGLVTGIVGPNTELHDAPALVTVLATDGTYTGTARFFFTVNPHVVIGAIADQTGIEGGTASVQVTASSMGALSLTYAAMGLPPGLSINASTGLISGTIAAETANLYGGTVAVTDGTYTAKRWFNWTVAPRVAITPIADRTGAEGDSISFQVVANAGGGAMTFAATNLPPGLSINSTTGLITGTLASPPLDGAPPAHVLVTSGPYSSAVTFKWAVAPRVAITAPATQSNREGDSVSLQVVATVPGGGTMSYAATDLPPGLAINSSTGLITGTISAVAATDEAYHAVVTVTQGASSARVRFFWAVNDRVDIAYIANQTSVVGGSVSLSVAATIAGGGALAYSVTGLPSGLSINSSTGVISGTLATGAATLGTPLNVTVTASSGGYSATQSFKWNVETPVTSGGLTARSASYSGVEGQRLSVGGTAWGWPTVLESASATSGGALAVTAVNGSSSAVGNTVTLSSGGKVTLNANGKFDYDAAASFTGVDSFNVTVANALFSVVVSVFVDVRPAPAALPDLDAVVLKLFDRLSQNGELTLARINREISNNDYVPADRRAEAAALIVLKSYVMNPRPDAASHRETFFGQTSRKYLVEFDIQMYNRRRRLAPFLTDPVYERAKELNDWYKLWAQAADRFATSDSTKVADVEKLIWGENQLSADLAKQIT